MKVTGKAVQVKAGAVALTRLKERFSTWRAWRKLGMRIPPALWSEAVEMVAVHGACRVAGELNLDYDMLKQRVAHPGGRGADRLSRRYRRVGAPLREAAAGRPLQRGAVQVWIKLM